MSVLRTIPRTALVASRAPAKSKVVPLGRREALVREGAPTLIAFPVHRGLSCYKLFRVVSLLASRYSSRSESKLLAVLLSSIYLLGRPLRRIAAAVVATCP